jgi:predicted acetyltransferase
MATEIRRLAGDEYERYAVIANDAYPGATAPVAATAERIRQAEGYSHPIICYGAFRDGELLGGMRYFDFTMSFHGAPIPVGGVGFLAVDLLHKKRRVAHDMVLAYMRHYRGRGAPMAALYPFRPDFYGQMGFGYGAPTNHYRLLPASFPQGPRAHLRALTPADAPALLACHNRYAARTHGLFLRGEELMARFLAAPERRVVAYVEGDEVQGYLLFQFQKGATFLDNSIEVIELIWEHPAALAELCAFLHTQADQVARVILNVQDDQLHQLVRDPRNGTGNLYPQVAHESSAQALGIMYRLLDTAAFFRALPGHSFGGASMTLAIAVRDDFLPEAAGEVVVRFDQGLPHVDPGAAPEVRLRIDVAHLSSLVMGATDFRTLQRYGLAEIDDPGYSGRVHRLFLSEARPVCVTPF